MAKDKVLRPRPGVDIDVGGNDTATEADLQSVLRHAGKVEEWTFSILSAAPGADALTFTLELKVWITEVKPQ